MAVRHRSATSTFTTSTMTGSIASWSKQPTHPFRATSIPNWLMSWVTAHPKMSVAFPDIKTSSKHSPTNGIQTIVILPHGMDCRSTPMSPKPTHSNSQSSSWQRSGSQQKSRQSGRTCVDAPSDASVFFGQVPACDQMRPCVRPRFAALTRRGPVWSFAGQVHFAYAHLIGAPSGCWFSRPRSDDRMPLPVLLSAHIPDATRPAAAYAAAAGSR